jgi:A/G-specific adenine glycosylase
MNAEYALLLSWYDAEKRELPWRNTTEPYFIWLSEIMLQQTRVDQMMTYFNRFTSRFPTVNDLAAAPLHEVLKLWEGLGYYSRARNLHTTAKIISNEYGGRFPQTYGELLKLKGIGPYTAAAISSIAFGEAKGVVDGNVLRVASRFLGIKTDITKPEARLRVQTWADELAALGRPGDINQALMELGATVCKPAKPLCGRCPLKSRCFAFATGKAEDLPYKPKKAPVPKVTEIAFLAFDETGNIFVCQRPPSGFLGGLWKFPSLQIEDSSSELLNRGLFKRLSEKSVKHAYTHFKITVHPVIGPLPENLKQNTVALPVSSLNKLAMDKVSRRIADMLQHDLNR